MHVKGGMEQRGGGGWIFNGVLRCLVLIYCQISPANTKSTVA